MVGKDSNDDDDDGIVPLTHCSAPSLLEMQPIDTVGDCSRSWITTLERQVSICRPQRIMIMHKTKHASSVCEDGSQDLSGP